MAGVREPVRNGSAKIGKLSSAERLGNHHCSLCVFDLVAAGKAEIGDLDMAHPSRTSTPATSVGI